MSYKNYRKKEPRSRRKPQKRETFCGTVQSSDKGFAFIIPDDREKYPEDFFVTRDRVNGALNGDKVLCEKVPTTKDGARVVKIISRANTTVIGTLEKSRKTCLIYPDDNRLPPIYVPNNLTFNAKDGDKVVCEVTSYPKGKSPGGKVIEVLGESGDFDCEELSIIRAFGLETEFSEAAEREAEHSSRAQISAENRRDLRELTIITIDGEDTRDIDDGVSLIKEGENYVLGVHIADVSHYVKAGSTLDKEAYSRGTSVYFPDRVLPMLPKALSNGACSLNEGEDRYALSCEMTFTRDGKRLSYEIFKSVIRSKHRTTYNEIESILQKDPDICLKYRDIADVVEDMGKLCLALEKRREGDGSVNLDVKEAHIYVDENDEIVIPPCERMLSQRVIEQFMISANEAVAEFLQKNKAPCLYRIHERPDPERAQAFLAFLRDLGLNANADTENIEPKDFQRILKSAEDKPYFSVVNKVMLRSMQKAKYSEANAGHFGLASKCYCHFTSPIRRYPDLFVHRALKCVLGGSPEKAIKLYGERAHGDGVHCSDRERIADEAERRVDDLYKLAYMQERLGEEFDAVVSGVTAHNLFCELENTVEGMIPLEDLPKDNYEFIPEKFMLKGGRRSFRLGDTVKIVVADCDLGRMKVIFRLSEQGKL